VGTERWAIVIRGVVQGVGFRPFVFDVASRLGLGGVVRNDDGAVVIEVEGDSVLLDQFFSQVTGHPLTLARIESVSRESCSLLGENTFRIDTSQTTAIGADRAIFISPDVATCGDCLRELLDERDRRYRYPFINCTNCGPRLTIITGAPYDRAQTTMRSFAMCPQCQAKYDDPRDRRFHAQPICCPRCGPQLALLDAAGTPINSPEPIRAVADALRAGRIVAIKGLGGFHLACDAASTQAVSSLRLRKHRDEKPFAIMVRNLAAVHELCEICPEEAQLLESAGRPIVLLEKLKDARADIADGVAPGNRSLGVMLPYTPLHHLLMEEIGSAPLVMTSGNRSDEPIACENGEAIASLNGIADLFLVHNRPIHVRCDDSVTRICRGKELPIRRSRGYAPRPILLPLPCLVPTLAVGGQLKGTFALARASHAFVSHHLGDLDHYEAFRAFERDVTLYEGLFDLHPQRIMHDLHPDYASTTYALRRDASEGVALVPVQHHHAHMASCMAEHGLNQPVIGVSFDGTGYGLDGAVWGGEFLIGDCARVRRAAHLRYVRLPGGDVAVREPWRMALAYATDAECHDATIGKCIPENDRKTVRRMIERGFNSPLTSSAGRLFDAVAALAGVRDRSSYEGQAAIELEQLANGSDANGIYPFRMAFEESSGSQENIPSIVLDVRPMIQAVLEEADGGVASSIIARRFHFTIVDAIAKVCGRLRDSGGPGVVVLSGGVFMNVLLTSEATVRLQRNGFSVFSHHLVPPNDAGLSLGQLAIAAARDSVAGESALR
jgi:hydrogenase maturation protein HypF